MSYSIYFKYGGKKYKLPVNPEEIKRSRNLQIETYRILGDGQISIPSSYDLEEFSFEAEFPSQKYHYVEKGGSFKKADFFEKMFRKAQKNKKPIRFIASNDITDDISIQVLVQSIEVTEKAGEEGDKYISFKLLEYKGAGKRFVAVKAGPETVKQEEESQPENPAVTENKTHTVVSGDTLWGIARKYYGNGSLYTRIYAANSGIISNPNLIYTGQILTIPE